MLNQLICFTVVDFLCSTLPTKKIVFHTAEAIFLCIRFNGIYELAKTLLSQKKEDKVGSLGNVIRTNTQPYIQAVASTFYILYTYTL